MPTHGGPGRFDTVAGLLAATPPQLRLLDSSLPDDAERAAVRSCCAGRTELYREACASLVHARSTFFSDLNAALDADVFDSAFRFKSPSWLAKRAGHELLARVPLTASREHVPHDRTA
ncbi:hypothetical protein EMIHUDRAFT_254386 [Emiliania huxleyi CCMP1516]|nr:hypothetical protein EMIHUDRAFT_254386 [Emiliania huxleyi CCMP1516]EOD26878.1 hypothetical protein EMIHUDRAFT_254386 [Emiliania huxleyi CCMP1516]|eukprot:XP_005779307.1 hypothetical protein EMIHUDRAFT_254386 [Emiliania huxleyi CCMP1516]